ncbi:MAG TPA: MBL fold metallo-hydrolase [Polyangiales bacterium]|nr:MBL fold metallo-hydrolase [Polyangiales bacterium]
MHRYKWLTWVAGALVLVAAQVRAADTISEVEPGTLPAKWSTGSAHCTPRSPEFQFHAYNEDFSILRESGCTHEEKPFLYLFFGSDKALLLDTGAGYEANVRKPDVAGAVRTAIKHWLWVHKRRSIPLLVSHLHSHGDHTFGDAQLAELPNTTVVPPSDVAALQAAFGISTWPNSITAFDLGGRVLDVIPIPGHDDTSIAFYDRRTGVLLTGDTLYPGRVYVNGDPNIFEASVQRLVDFTSDKVVTHILGTHIEQKGPYVDWPVGTAYVPVETGLALTRGNLLELLEGAHERTADRKIVPRGYRDFSLCGPYPTCERVNQ